MFCKTTWNRPLHAQSHGTTTRFSNCCVDMLEVLKPIHRSYSSAIGVVAFKTKCTQRQTRPARNLVLADVVTVNNLTDLIISKCLVETAVTHDQEFTSG